MTTKRPIKNVMMPDGTPKEEAIDIERPQQELMGEFSRQIFELQRRLTKLEAEHGTVSMYMPRLETPMNRREVEATIRENPKQWFEAIDDYDRAGLNLNKGKLFCVQNYRGIPGHVGAGLKIMRATPPQ